ncbi:MAG: hypothetical protein EPO42_09565 [Gallionellaceae bacterium]|nr:MAG: hypothetical protein EPO42_09565 [Gallionellaceae bacterium]
MDKKTVFVKTGKGDDEVKGKGKGESLSGDIKRALFLIDDRSTFDEVSKRAAPSLRAVIEDVFSQLVVGGYIRDKDKPFAEPQIAKPRIVAPASDGELDFTGLSSAPVQSSATLGADKARARAELEAAVEAAKTKARAEAEAKAEANAKLAAEIAARNKAEADVRAKQDALVREQAEARAKQEAEARVRAEQAAARVKAEAEALIRQQAEIAARAKAEAEIRVKRETEAARIKAEQEAARVRAELEAAAKAQAEAEAARLKAEQEAAHMRVELEAAKARAEAEARALAEEHARQEAEAARLRAEQEAARIKTEAEARALAEERARQEAETARIRAEQEAARMRAELETAKAKAEAEARALAEERARQEAEAKALAEERAKQEAEAARLRAEQETTVRVKAELEVARAQAEAEARALAEEHARQEVARQRAEHETNRIRAEAEAAKAAAEAQATAPSHVENAIPQSETVPEAHRHGEGEGVKPAPARVEQAEQEAAVLKTSREEQRLAEEQAKAWAAAEQRAQDQARIGAARPVQAAAAPVKATPQRVESTRRKSLPWGKIAAGLFVLAALSLVFLPYVMPLGGYIPTLEQKLSAQLKQPVHVGNLRASTLPLPRLQLEKITVGAGQELKVGSAVVTFDLFSLFSEVKSIRNVELREVVLNGATFDKELAWLQAVGANKNYPAAHLTIKSAKVSSEEIALPEFSGEIDVDERGNVTKAMLKSGDAKFDATLQPMQDRWQITLNAHATAFPLFPNVLFDDLTAKGEIGAAGANFVTVEGQAYGGFLHGNAKLYWQKGWQLQGRVEASSIEAEKLFPKFGVAGALGGESNFAVSGIKLGKLADAPQMDGSFVLSKGVINGMDMVETARQGGRQSASGGRTHFDELAGNFQTNSRGLRFQQLKISSGILSGSGSFEVGNGAQLSGRFTVELKARAGTASLVLSGTPTEPVLRAGR